MYPASEPLVVHQFPPDDLAGHVACNRERDFVAVCSEHGLVICLSFPPLLLCSVDVASEDRASVGSLQRILWKPNSGALLVSTSNNCLLLYKISIDWNNASEVYHEEPSFGKSSASQASSKIVRLVPKVKVALKCSIHLPAQITCFVSLKEEFVVCLRSGAVHRFLWDGQAVEDLCWSIEAIPFYQDQTQSKPQYVLCTDGQSASVHFVDICYSPFLGGFLAVISNGRAALITASSPRYHSSELRAVWVPSAYDVSCCSANNRYRLMAFGCKSSVIQVFHVDDTTGAIVQTYQADLSSVGNPELTRNLGPVQQVDWSPYGSHLVVLWQSSAVACWSTFGSRLWFNLSSFAKGGQTMLTFDWGREGYQLWLLTDVSLLYLRMLKVCDYDCRPLELNERIVLHTHDRIFLSPESDDKDVQTPWPLSFWRQSQVPAEYQSLCWPVRFCHFDPIQGVVCVAGVRGFVYYTTATKKWRLFGSEAQERQFVVGCSPRCWRGHVVLGCYDFETETDEIRFYSLSTKLDSDSCVRVIVEAGVLLLSVRNDALLTFDMEAKCILYEVSINDSAKVPSEAVLIERRTVILVSDLVPHPVCVVAAQMFTRDSATTEATFCKFTDTVLLNISGRLVMLTPQIVTSRRNSASDVHSSQLEVPLLIASFVEEIWCGHCGDSTKPHLQHAIWITSGCRGVHLWMPLVLQSSPESASSQQKSFISKWIMLNFVLRSMYPLAVCPLKCFFLGVETESNNSEMLIEYKREVFLHHVLKQLLKRNLGVYAWDIATTCRDLSYFEHVLELLLHNVLEEEGACSDPIPNPLLPTVIEFLRELPEFLQVIAHCARKTEMALWNYLFQYTGSPRQLFQLCLKDNLETAACYFIILQSTESAANSKMLATTLLEAVLQDCKWSIACEIIRFLKAIDPSDLDSPPVTPLVLLKQSAQPRVSIISSNLLVDPSDAAFALASKSHHSSGGTTETVVHADGPALCRLNSREEHLKNVLINGEERVEKADDADSMDTFVQGILCKHAGRLLSEYRLYDLAMFALQVHFRFIPWLISERNGAAAIVDYPQAMVKLLCDFQVTIKIDKAKYDEQALAKGAKPLKNTEQVVGQLNLELLEDPTFDRSTSKEALLNFLQQVMLNTMCLDWLLIICLATDDVETFGRVTSHYGTSDSFDSFTLKRLTNGLQQMSVWAKDNCVALLPLLNAVSDSLGEVTANKGYLTNGERHLNGVLHSREPSSCSSLSIASSPPSGREGVAKVCANRRRVDNQLPLSASFADAFLPQDSANGGQAGCDLVNPMSPSDSAQCTLM